MLNEHKAFFIALQTSDHPDGAVPYGVGEPGIAKTRRTAAFAKFIERGYECIIGSQRLPEDVLGAPKVLELTGRNGSQHVMEHVPPGWRFRLENHARGGLLHLDELGDCQPAMQAALLQILADGVPNSWICATGNPVEISTNGYELSLPAINRLCQINWPDDRAAWERGMINGWDSLADDFPVLPSTWTSQLPGAKALVVNFCRRNTAHFQQMPRTVGEVAPWPSMRSWTHTATVLAAAKSLGVDEDVEDLLILGCVGRGAAIAFRNWIKSLDLPDPEALLADPKLFDPKSRGDLAFATLCAVVAAVLSNNTVDRWQAAWKIFERQCSEAADIAAAVCGPLAANRPKGADAAELRIPKSVEKKLFAILNVQRAASDK